MGNGQQGEFDVNRIIASAHHHCLPFAPDCSNPRQRAGHLAENRALLFPAKRIRRRVRLLSLSTALCKWNAGEISCGLGASPHGNFELLAWSHGAMAAAD